MGGMSVRLVPIGLHGGANGAPAPRSTDGTAPHASASSSSGCLHWKRTESAPGQCERFVERLLRLLLRRRGLLQLRWNGGSAPPYVSAEIIVR